jgi:hypothetical protein
VVFNPAFVVAMVVENNVRIAAHQEQQPADEPARRLADSACWVPHSAPGDH